MRRHEFFIGVDVGLQGDFTTIAVIKRGPQLAPDQLPELHVVDLQRTRGTTFVAVAAEINRLVDHLGGAAVAVDATGVGEGCWQESRRIGLRPIAVVIGGGTKVGGGPTRWTVPHSTLYERLYGVFATGRFRIAESLPMAENLIRELQLVQAKRTDRGQVHYEVPRTDQGHGDLLMGLALATLLAEHQANRLVMQHRATTRPKGGDRPQGKPRQRGNLAKRIVEQRKEESRDESLRYAEAERDRFRKAGWGTK
jgi:hypothetical protein